MDPTAVKTLYDAGGISLLLLAGMGFGLVQIGKYIAAEREKDRQEKEKLAATFSGAIRDVSDKHESAVKTIAGEFREELKATRAEAKAVMTQVLDAIHGVHSSK